MEWRDLCRYSYRYADKEEEEDSDKNKEEKEKPVTDNKELSGAGYVQEEDFKSFVESTLDSGVGLKGYYCATCEYFKPTEGGETTGVCKKFDAAVEDWGCCNAWEYE